MTFKDVAIKNFRANLRKYLACFLSMCFSISVFFIYSTIIYNKGLVKAVFEIDGIAKEYLIVIGVFSTFFINYAQSSFIKSRNKELGLLSILGMTPRNIRTMLLIENIIIVISSIIVGMISGTIFSKLFYLIITSLLGLENISFTLCYKSYILTLISFILIFITTFIFIRITTRKLEAIELLRSSKKHQTNKITTPVLGIMGLLLFVGSFIMQEEILRGKIFAHNQIALLYPLIPVLVGIYLIISQFGSMFLSISKHFKKYYYKNVIHLSEINYRFSANKKVMYLICITSAFMIFLVGVLFSSYRRVVSDLRASHPYDISYIEAANMNKLPEYEFEKIIKTSKTPLVKKSVLEFINLDLYIGKNHWDSDIVISDKNFNKFCNQKISILEGSAYSLAQLKKKESAHWLKKGKIVSLCYFDKTFKFIAKKEITKVIVNNDNMYFGDLFMIIINSKEYGKIKSEIGKQIVGKIHLLKFKDWMKTDYTANKLTESLTKANKNKFSINNKFFNQTDKKYFKEDAQNIYSGFEIDCMKRDFTEQKNQNSFFLFMTSFIAILFFIMSGSILYFKLYTDIDEARQRYKKLFKVGIRDKEMKKIISGELRIIFFFPLIIASITALADIYIFGAYTAVSQQAFYDSIIIVFIYLVIQYVNYLNAKRSFIKNILYKT